MSTKMPYTKTLLEIPEFVAPVSEEALAITRDLLGLAQVVWGEARNIDVRGFTGIWTSAAHPTRPDTKLLVSKLCELPKNCGTDSSSMSENQANIGVKTQAGEMFVTLHEPELPKYDFTNDPFVDMIMGYFRSHVESTTYQPKTI